MHYSITQHQRSLDWENHKSEKSKALIQILPFGIRILVWLEQSEELVALDEIQFTKDLTIEEQFGQFRNFIGESVLNEATVLAVTLVIDTPYFTLLPATLFEEASAKANLESLSKIPFSYQFFFDKTLENMVLTFAVPKIWTDWAEQVFSNSEVNWRCGVSGYVKQANQQESGEESALYAHIHPKSLTALGIKNKGVEFLNQFSFQTENDLLYYLLLAANESGINPETDRVWLSGSILAGSSGYEKLNRYFGNLVFVKNPSVPSAFPWNEGLQKPLYFDLLSVYLEQRN